MYTKMDRFLLNYNGNKYQETKKILPVIENKYDIIVEPFGGIFGFSRAFYYFKSDNVEFLINDIDGDLINLFNKLKQNPEKLLNEVKKFIDSFESDKELSDYLRKKEEKTIIKTLALYICQHRSIGIYNLTKGKIKIKNFLEKLDNYKEFFKRCSFYNYSYDVFLDKIKNKIGKKLIFFDPPYFNSHNAFYQKLNNEQEGDYKDGTQIYIYILEQFHENTEDDLIFVCNKISIIDYLFKAWKKSEVNGSYGSTNKNGKKNIKKHITYLKQN
jgi:site-specific DNA-adenine methylase